MNTAPNPKRDWVISQEAFDRLLEFLDSDDQLAGQKYERIRGKLLKFFRWRGCVAPEEYADKTIDRVARRLLEGAELRSSDPYLYFHGVALNILKEHWREPEREHEAFDHLPVSRSPFENPYERNERELEQLEKEQQLECLDECVKDLPMESLDLITNYHGPEGLSKERRKELAQSLNIPMNALRIRAYRIRSGLEGCVANCLKRGRKR